MDNTVDMEANAVGHDFLYDLYRESLIEDDSLEESEDCCERV